MNSQPRPVAGQVVEASAATPATAQPLAGTKVLDLSSPVGPYCGYLLASLGATVTLVEPPQGDPYRHLGPYLANTDNTDTKISLAYAYYHAGKRSVTCDLSSSAGQQQIQNLAAETDVILIAPSGLNPLWGFDVDTKTLSWAPADAIVCSITPFGVGGPYWYRPYTHFTSFAHGGQMSATGTADIAPLAAPGEIHWHIAATHAVVGILAALATQNTVGGQFLDISAQEVEAFQLAAVSGYHARGLILGQREAGYVIPPSGVWECADGRVDIAAYSERHWPFFLQMLDNPAELAEPSLADMSIRRQIFDGLVPLISDIIAPHKREELFEKGQHFGLPICLRNTPSEFIADTQLQERNYWAQIQTTNGTRLLCPGAPIKSNPSLFSCPDTHGFSDYGASDATPDNASDATPDSAATPARKQTASSAASSTGTPLKNTPLEGFRVLSLGTFVAGNVCAQILAGLGAEVVKVERPSQPDALRDAGFNDARKLAVEPSGATNTPMHAQLTRGLKNLALDMSTPQGLDTFKQLVRNCDVLIENFSGSVMSGWGATFGELCEHNPQLIMASMSGYGRTGSRATFKAYASNIATHTGLAEVWWTSGTLTDYATAVHTALAIQAARIHVAQSQSPVYIDAAQTEVFAAMAARIYMDPLVNGQDTTIVSNYSQESLLTHVTRCLGNDRWAIVEIQDIAQWNAVCELLECSELELNPTDAGNANVNESSAALVAVIDKWAKDRTPRSVAHLLAEAGVPAASVANPEEVYDDPQLQSRGYLEHVQHLDLGHLVLPAPPQRMSATPSTYAAESSRVGQHSRQILASWAGLSASQIDELIAADVVLDASSY